MLADSAGQMQRRDNPSTILLQPLELGHRFLGFGNPDLDTRGSDFRERFLRDLHSSVVAGADHQHLRQVGQDGLEVLRCQSMACSTPPMFLYMVGKDDHVGIVVAAGNTDVSESVMIDFHENRVFMWKGSAVSSAWDYILW